MNGHLLLTLLASAEALPQLQLRGDREKLDEVYLAEIGRFQEYFASLREAPELLKFATEVLKDPVFLTADSTSPVPRAAAESLRKKIARSRFLLQAVKSIVADLTQEKSQILIRLPPTDNLSDLGDVTSKLEEIFDYPLLIMGEPKVRFVGAEAGSTILGLLLASAKGVVIVGAILQLFFWFVGAVLKLRESVSFLETASRQRELGIDLMEMGVKGLREQLAEQVGKIIDAHTKDLDETTKTEAKLRICNQGADVFREMIDKGMEITVASNAPQEIKEALPARMSLQQLQGSPAILALPRVTAVEPNLTTDESSDLEV